jgi:hypothetical protein
MVAVSRELRERESFHRSMIERVRLAAACG